MTGLIASSSEEVLIARTDVGGLYSLRWPDDEDDMEEKNTSKQQQLFSQLYSSFVDPSDAPRLRTASVASVAAGNGVSGGIVAAVGSGAGSSGGDPGFMLSANEGSSWTFVSVSFAIDGNDHKRKWGERLAVINNNNVTMEGDNDGNYTMLGYGSENDGLFMSDDGGVTWKRNDALAVGEAPGVVFLTTQPDGGGDGGGLNIKTKPQVVYAGVWGKGVYRSSDGGGTWVAIDASPLFPCRFAWLNDSNNTTKTAAAATMVTGTPTLVVTSNSSVNAYDVGSGGFVDISPETKAPMPYCAVATLGDSVLAVAGAVGSFKEAVYISEDAGKTWSKDLVSISVWASDVPWWPRHWFASAASSIALKRTKNGNGVRAALATWYGVWFCDDLFALQPTWYTREKGHEELVNLDLAVPPPPSPPSSLNPPSPSSHQLPRVLLYSGHADVGGFRHTNLSSFPSVEDKFDGTQSTASIDVCEADANILVRVGGNEPGDSKGCGQGFVSVDSGITWDAIGTFDGACGGVVMFVSPPAAAGGGPCDWIVWTPFDGVPLVSSDFGKRWERSVGAPAGASGTSAKWEGGHMHQIAADKMGGGRSFLFHPNNGLFGSSDGGRNWDMINQTTIVGQQQQLLLRQEPGHLQVDPLVRGFMCLCQMNGGLLCLDKSSALVPIGGIASCRLVAFGAPLSADAAEDDGSAPSSQLYVFGRVEGATGDDDESVFLFGGGGGPNAAFAAKGADDWIKIGSPNFRMAGAASGKMVADRSRPGRVFIGAGGQGIYVGSMIGTSKYEHE